MTEIQVTPDSLATVGVKLLDRFRVRLQCKTCGLIWQPIPCPEVRLPPRWWQCPRGCNKHLG